MRGVGWDKKVAIVVVPVACCGNPAGLMRCSFDAGSESRGCVVGCSADESPCAVVFLGTRRIRIVSSRSYLAVARASHRLDSFRHTYSGVSELFRALTGNVYDGGATCARVKINHRKLIAYEPMNAAEYPGQ